MSIQIPVRLGPAELTLIEQLQAAGATSDVERLSAVGLPTRRVEAYHYTDLKTLWREVPPLAAPADAIGRTLSVPGALPFAIVNGKVAPHGDLPDGLWAGKNDVAGITKIDDIVVRLNVALAKEALNLQIAESPGKTICIDRRTEGVATHAVDAASIFVGDGVEVTIVETYGGSDAAHVSNHSTFLSVGRDARVTHVTIDLSAKAARTFATNEYALSEGATLRSLTINAGSVLNRTNVHAGMMGQGAHGDFTGLNLVSAGQHHDITLQVDHKVRGTSCKPLYKQVARGRSTAVFQGRLVVARDAQKTDAKLMTQGLMLSEEAEILSKPELEIFADDVVCGHGSTCGALDETSLFYLMSRGIPRAAAETILVRAFLQELIDPIADEGLQEALTVVIEGWLAGAP